MEKLFKSLDTELEILDYKIKSDKIIITLVSNRKNVVCPYYNQASQNVELLTCDKMGHPMPAPYIIPISETLSMNMMGGVFSSGGTIEGNAEGQFKSWQRTIEFFMEPLLKKLEK